jgi:hypothetical protein
MGRVGALVVALAALLGAEAVPARAQSPGEIAFWNRVRDTTNPGEMRAYLEAYPNGAFADMARARLKVLEPLRPQSPGGGPSMLGGASLIREVQERLYNLN